MNFQNGTLLQKEDYARHNKVSVVYIPFLLVQLNRVLTFKVDTNP